MSRFIIPGLIIGSKVSIANSEPSSAAANRPRPCPRTGCPSPDSGSPRPLALYGQDTHQQSSD
ncbi:hypothetical protein M5E88_10745 [Akkermansia muciniphila]|nr:hypothetical protein M5E88_10745 [Akkermansia muciniphila]